MFWVGDFANYKRRSFRQDSFCELNFKGRAFIPLTFVTKDCFNAVFLITMIQ